jgi:hypothetical protein
MTTKAEKLAWELVALTERYSPKDFEKATELLLSGQLFAQTTEAALSARQALAASTRKDSKAKDSGNPKRNKGTQIKAERLEPTQLELDEILREVAEPERERLDAFALRFLNRDILRTGLSARAFAEQVGIDLPLKLPSRASLLKLLLQELSRLPKDSRDNWLAEAERSGSGESSLQRWSDLIVKG